MGVEHCCHCDGGTELLVIYPELFERFYSTGKQRLVDLFLMSSGECPQRVGYGKGRHKILYGQEFLALTFKPQGRFMILAPRATTVTTRMIAAAGLQALRRRTDSSPEFYTPRPLDIH